MPRYPTLVKSSSNSTISRKNHSQPISKRDLSHPLYRTDNMAPRQGLFMKHYAIDQWADFTRGLKEGAELAEMQWHLQSGCARCRGLSKFTTKLSATCSCLATDPVPEST